MHILLQIRICYRLVQTPITSQTYIKMATTHKISIDSKAYQMGQLYASLHNVSVKKLIEDYFMSLSGHSEKISAVEEPLANYHISEKLKEVETGIDYGKGLSLDYKKEDTIATN